MDKEHDDDHFYSIKPDGLQGYDNAAEDFGRVLQDAERRMKALQYTHDGGWPARIVEIRLHPQPRKDYQDPKEKSRIVQAAEEVLNATVECTAREDPVGQERFEEALSAMRMEDEQVFVLAVLGNVHHLIYWNWRYGYAVKGPALDCNDRQFRNDVDLRLVASPELARTRYGSIVCHENMETDDNEPG